MEYVVVAFRSRAQTIRFYSFLNSNNIPCEIINTPKEAGVGCGLSVKIDKSMFGIVKQALWKINLNSFAGFFLVLNVKNKRIVRSI